MITPNYLEKLLDGVEVEWNSLGDVCDVYTGGEAPQNCIKGLIPNDIYKYPIYANGEKLHSISNEWELESAKYDLALCLCEEYLKKPDKEIKDKILKLYKEDMTYYRTRFPKNLDFNLILKNRKEIFDPTILID